MQQHRRSDENNSISLMHWWRRAGGRGGGLPETDRNRTEQTDRDRKWRTARGGGGGVGWGGVGFRKWVDEVGGRMPLNQFQMQRECTKPNKSRPFVSIVKGNLHRSFGRIDLKARVTRINKQRLTRVQTDVISPFARNYSGFSKIRSQTLIFCCFNIIIYRKHGMHAKVWWFVSC